MKDSMKIKLVQAMVIAIVLTLLMQPAAMLGFGTYIWMLFLPILLFFALGADFKIIPALIVSYVCGIAWAFINGIIQNIFAGFITGPAAMIIPTIIVIFSVLMIHQNLLEKTVFGNIPALFMGMATTFFVFMMQVDLSPIHLIGFFIYGLIMAVAMMVAGGAVCSAIFGKEKAMAVITGQEQ